MKLIDEFIEAWKTFKGAKAENGWQVIPVSGFPNCNLMAGLAMPTSREAAFFSFLDANIPRAELLPNGMGFAIEPIEMDDRIWLALTRNEQGMADLYVAMLENLFDLLNGMSSSSGDALLHAFLERVAAWQDFMKKGSSLLTIESQTGLYGELSLLKDILDLGLVAEAVRTWDGPLNGMQDFHVGFGAIEVKSTVSTTGFIAKIGSLDQLSDSTFKPIFLIGKRLSISDDGVSLSMLIDSIRSQLRNNPSSANDFEARLIRSGYLDIHAKAYDRLLKVQDSLMYEVDDDFPRLTPQLVNSFIKSARYEIEISSLPSKALDLKEILNKVGVSV